MEPDEVVLSDVHVGATSEKDDETGTGYRVSYSRFEFTTSDDETDEEQSGACVDTDVDGDLILCRKKRKLTEAITIEHAMETRLKDVGLQVWSGCLLLCDYILHQKELFRDKVVLELGCGVGLSSIVAGTAAKTVICTDMDQKILDMCTRNIERNNMLFEGVKTDQSKIVPKLLDWSEDDLRTDPNEIYSWRPPDVHLATRADVIIAADVIYDVDATESLFKTLFRWMTKKSVHTAYISLEKRLNFTLDDKDVACPAYDHYRHCVEDLDGEVHQPSGVTFQVSQIKTDFPQYFKYQRTEYLEIWKVEAKRQVMEVASTCRT